MLCFSNSVMSPTSREDLVSVGAYVAENWYTAAISLLTSSRLRSLMRYKLRIVSLKGSQTGSIGSSLFTKVDIVEGYGNETQIKASVIEVLRIVVLWIEAGDACKRYVRA